MSKADGCPSQVAPTFEQLYDQGRYSVSPHWQRRELAQANLDWEEVSLHGEENVTRITSVSELQLAQAARRRRRNVQLTEASQVRMLPTKPVRSRLTSAGRLLRPSWTRWPCTTTLDLVLRVRARLRLLGQLSRRLMRICWARPSSSTSSTNRSLSLSRRPKVLLAGDTAARGRLWFPSLLSVFFCRRRRGRRQRSWADVYVRGTDGSIRRPSALERRLAEGRAGASGSRG